MPMGVGEPGQGIYKNPQGGILSGSAEQQLAQKNLIRDAIIRAGGNPGATTRLDVARGYIGSGGAKGSGTGTAPRQPGMMYAFGGSGGGSGGGGGGGASPQMSQALLDWYAKTLQGGAPQQLRYTPMQLGAYQAYQPQQFNGQMYDQLQGQWNSAVAQDTARAQQAGKDLTSYLQENQANAFLNGPQPSQVGMGQQAMANYLQSQGVNPAAGQDVGAGGANQAFQNLWQTMAMNEQSANQGRLANAQFQTNDALNRINAAGLGGTAQIGVARGNAQQAFDARQQEYMNQDRIARQQRADQLAMANWQRQNSVADTNATNQSQYSQAQIQALLGLLPQLVGTNLNLPDAAALFGAH